MAIIDDLREMAKTVGLLKATVRADGADEELKAQLAELATDFADFREDSMKAGNGWVTMNGTHVLIGAGGTVVGGPARLQGMKYRQYYENHKAVTASDQAGLVKYQNPKTSKQSYISQALHAQGFDGLPKIVDKKEFDKARKASKFVAQRIYCGTTQAVTDAYQQQFYSGDYYVDCASGGAQYGKGMYTAADYTGTLSSGIKTEMTHYKQQGASKGARHSATETMTLDPSAKIVDFGDVRGEYIRSCVKQIGKPDRAINSALDQVQKCAYKVDNLPGFMISNHMKANSYDLAALGQAYSQLKSAVKAKYGASGEKAVNDAINRAKTAHNASEFGSTDIDIGVLAAECGFDAINAKGHGASGSYTVVLNRTKLLVQGTPLHKDSADPEPAISEKDLKRVKFAYDKSGALVGTLDGKEIGKIYTMGDTLDLGGERKLTNMDHADSSDFREDASGAWRTMPNGVHVFINGAGVITKGPSGTVGKTPAQLGSFQNSPVAQQSSGSGKASTKKSAPSGNYAKASNYNDGDTVTVGKISFTKTSTGSFCFVDPQGKVRYKKPWEMDTILNKNKVAVPTTKPTFTDNSTPTALNYSNLVAAGVGSRVTLADGSVYTKIGKATWRANKNGKTLNNVSMVPKAVLVTGSKTPTLSTINPAGSTSSTPSAPTTSSASSAPKPSTQTNSTPTAAANTAKATPAANSTATASNTAKTASQTATPASSSKTSSTASKPQSSGSNMGNPMPYSGKTNKASMVNAPTGTVITMPSGYTYTKNAKGDYVGKNGKTLSPTLMAVRINATVGGGKNPTASFPLPGRSSSSPSKTSSAASTTKTASTTGTTSPLPTKSSYAGAQPIALNSKATNLSALNLAPTGTNIVYPSGFTFNKNPNGTFTSQNGKTYTANQMAQKVGRFVGSKVPMMTPPSTPSSGGSNNAAKATPSNSTSTATSSKPTATAASSSKTVPSTTASAGASGLQNGQSISVGGYTFSRTASGNYKYKTPKGNVISLTPAQYQTRLANAQKKAGQAGATSTASGNGNAGNAHGAKGAPRHNIVTGKDISKTFNASSSSKWSACDQAAYQQGFKGKPQVVKDLKSFNQIVNQSGFVGFRTINNGTDVVTGKRKTSQQFINDVKNGDENNFALNGKGGQAFGGGMYIAVNAGAKKGVAPSTVDVRAAKADSKMYGSHNPHMMKVTLDPTAKIGRYSAVRKQFNNLSHSDQQRFGGDEGAYAASLGYDGLVNDFRYSGQNGGRYGYLTLYNRTKLVVFDTNEF